MLFFFEIKTSDIALNISRRWNREDVEHSPLSMVINGSTEKDVEGQMNENFVGKESRRNFVEIKVMIKIIKVMIKIIKVMIKILAKVEQMLF